jgi:hypothetical protein
MTQKRERDMDIRGPDDPDVADAGEDLGLPLLEECDRLRGEA